MGRLSFFSKVVKAMNEECKIEGYKNTTINFPVKTKYGEGTLYIEFIRENEYDYDTEPFLMEIYITDKKDIAFDSVFCDIYNKEKELDYMLGMYKI